MYTRIKKLIYWIYIFKNRWVFHAWVWSIASKAQIRIWLYEILPMRPSKNKLWRCAPMHLMLHAEQVSVKFIIIVKSNKTNVVDIRSI